MAQEFGEPRTEEEAQELKRFLEEGAEVSLETVQRVEAAPTELESTHITGVRFPRAEDITGQVSPEETGTVAVLTLQFAHPVSVPAFSIGVFLNTTDADATTPFGVPGFVGIIAFFCHAEERQGELLCVDHGQEPISYRLPLTAVLERTGPPDDVTVALVPIPFPDRDIERQTLSVAGSIELVRSIVGERF
jgi:hypothetical protein